MTASELNPRRGVGCALLVVLVTACGSSPTASPAPSTSPSSSPSTTAVATAAPAPTPTSTLPAGVDQLLALTAAGGKVTGAEGRVKVKLGTTLQIVVTSDVKDEVHLHGYDEKVDVAAGGTARLTVKATIPGVFAIELEDSGLLLARLQVQ